MASQRTSAAAGGGPAPVGLVDYADADADADLELEGEDVDEGHGSDGAAVQARPSHKRRRAQPEPTSNCPICLEPWNALGKHRIVCLPCGHVFGRSCIERWLKGSKTCPQCNERTRPKDIRVVYIPNVAVRDNAAEEAVRAELELERAVRVEAEMGKARLQVMKRGLENRVRALEAEVASLTARAQDAEARLARQFRHAGGFVSSGATAAARERATEELVSEDVMDKVCLATEHNNLHDAVPLPPGSCEGEGEEEEVEEEEEHQPRKSIRKCESLCKPMSVHAARVVAACPSADSSLTLVVSVGQACSRGAFGLCGVSFRRGDDFCQPVWTSPRLHLASVRDASCTAQGSLVASASLDGTLGITSTKGGTWVHTYKTPSTPWSCAWEESAGGGETHVVHCGLANGSVITYDLRNTRDALRVIAPEAGSAPPVHSLSVVQGALENRASAAYRFLNGANASASRRDDAASCVLLGATVKGPFAAHSTDANWGALPAPDALRGRCVSLHRDAVTGTCVTRQGIAGRAPRHCAFECDASLPNATPAVRGFDGIGSECCLMSRVFAFSVPGAGEARALTADGRNVAVWSTRTGAVLATCSGGAETHEAEVVDALYHEGMIFSVSQSRLCVHSAQGLVDGVARE